ncbi:MAG: condensation domain-containing protein, partial [Bryobacteraceae bacterium]
MIADIYELSPIQQGMLFHALSEPDSAAYVNQLSCVLRGQLCPDRFQQAWQALVDRQPVLRTSFHSQNLDKPRQVVHKQAMLPWTFEDWRTLPSGTRREQWREEVESDRKAGFRLDRAPLMRCRLVQTAEDEYLFRWTHHHLLLDGWCLSIVLRELFDLYGRLDRGEVPSHPPQPEYRDFILWLQRQDAARTSEFWKNHLAGFAHPTPLPGRDRGTEAPVADAR